MLGRRRAGLAGPAHGLRHRELDLDHAVVGRAAAVASSGCGGSGREKGIDLVHRRSSSLVSHGACDTIAMLASAFGSAESASSPAGRPLALSMYATMSAASAPL